MVGKEEFLAKAEDVADQVRILVKLEIKLMSKLSRDFLLRNIYKTFNKHYFCVSSWPRK